MENIVHNYDTNVEHILFYFIHHVKAEYNLKPKPKINENQMKKTKIKTNIEKLI